MDPFWRWLIAYGAAGGGAAIVGFIWIYVERRRALT
jgi:hypothetical protein